MLYNILFFIIKLEMVGTVLLKYRPVLVDFHFMCNVYNSRFHASVVHLIFTTSNL